MTVKLDAMNRKFYDLMKGVKSQLDDKVVVQSYGYNGEIAEFGSRGLIGGNSLGNVVTRDMYLGAAVPFDSVGKDGDVFAMFNSARAGDMPSKSGWRAMASGGNDQVIAVADGADHCALGRISWETDYPVVEWEYIPLPTEARWSDIDVDDNGGYLMVSFRGEVAYSEEIPDFSYPGEDWTLGEPLDSRYQWGNVAYGNGIWVACAYGVWGKNEEGLTPNVSAVSTDMGRSWTYSTLPQETSWIDICYGSRGFVAISPHMSNVAVSPDGITWTAGELPTIAVWTSIAFGNDMYVAVAQNSSYVAHSRDGLNWVVGSLPFHGNWNCVECFYTMEGVLWVATAGRSDYIGISLNGVDWFEQSTPVSAHWTCIGIANDVLVYSGHDTDKCVYQYTGFLFQPAQLMDVDNYSNPTPPPVAPGAEPETFAPGSYCKAPSRELSKLAMWFEPIETSFMSEETVFEWNSSTGDVIGEMVNPPRGATSVIVEKQQQFHTVTITMDPAELSTLNVQGGFMAVILKDSCTPISDAVSLRDSVIDPSAGTITFPVFENAELFGNYRKYCLNIYR